MRAPIVTSSSNDRSPAGHAHLDGYQHRAVEEEVTFGIAHRLPTPHEWFGPELSMRLTDDWHNTWLPRFRDRQWWIQVASHPLGVITIWFALGVLYYGVNMGMDPGKVFYFTCVSITTVGYGDVVPESDPDKLFTCE